MNLSLLRLAGFLVVSLAMGCAEVPPESVAASRQLEKNVEILRQNNLLLLDEWYNLSVDYWTEKVGQEGPDKILEKAKQQGITVDLTKDYRDLVQQVLKEYRKNFLAKLNDSYQSYRDAINADYQLTMNGNRKLTNLLQSVVTVDAERAALIESVGSELKVNDEIEKVQSELDALLGS
jgi:hypothetical protein